MIVALSVPNLVLATIVVGVVAVVFRARVFGANERDSTSWVDAWLKAIVILVAVAFFLVYVPSWALQTKTVADMNRNAQDLIGAGLFAIALIVVLWVLRWAHAEKRV
ncbi:MAG: hypothetical protein ACR2P0_16700 [Acidimicrobiales bacterium]